MLTVKGKCGCISIKGCRKSLSHYWRDFKKSDLAQFFAECSEISCAHLRTDPSASQNFIWIIGSNMHTENPEGKYGKRSFMRKKKKKR